MAATKDRIACLDGLRALSIGLVILGHLAGTRGFPAHETLLFSSLATLGVRVFFVISGFLITSILLGELAETGTVHLRRFYLRRTMRIFVPYYAFLLCVLILDRCGVFVIPAPELASAATYTSNYRSHPIWQLGHTWSLSVEEQFYLLWPAALWLLRRGGALAAAVLVVAVSPALRLVLWHFVPSASGGVGHRFETVADALATGCLLSGLRAWLGQRPAYLSLLRARPTVPLAAACVLGAVVLDGHPRAAFGLGWSLQNLGIAVLIDFCLRHPESGLPSFFATRPLVFVGRMSYSVYLWQQLFLNRQSGAPLCSFPLNLFEVAVCATLSYYAVERTSMALRPQLERRLFRPRTPEVARQIPA